MEVNLIELKKLNILVSDESSPTSLTNFYTEHQTFSWAPSDGASHWIKINFFESIDLNALEFTWIGTIDKVKVEYSVDNFNWIELNQEAAADNDKKTWTYDYVENENVPEISYLRITVTNTSSFAMNSLRTASNVTFNNETFISHMYSSLYSPKEVEEYPLFPSIFKNVLEMYEDKIEKDKRLFDPTDFASASVAKAVNGSEVTLIGVDIPLDAMLYVWDFGEENAFEQTLNPLNQVKHTYAGAGTYYARLLCMYEHFQVEFQVKVVIV